MKSRLSRRREALIAQAADQRRQMGHAFAGIVSRLGLLDQGLDWILRIKRTTLLAAAAALVIAISRHGKLAKTIGLAMVALRALRIWRKLHYLLQPSARTQRSPNP